ncbi:holin (3TMs family) [Breoghania corrubedonensis]|uniref:Holin (3TMs family) n=1 Tax=Breoghania corrubedonensis TaxID=665038 RepID=A0A2T5UQ89_9HYPH|nr:hypothetical protein [Breoghania corrubedonensis]PTW53581.1 holin (3TMs family) [Breoghania corrubedonensis]
MTALATILISAAVKVGAPLVKNILQEHFGGAGSAVGGAVVDAIAKKVGVPVEDLETVTPAVIEDAVTAVEPEVPQLIDALVTAQIQGNKLMLAEMKKDSSFGWLWRPAGMWLMLGCITFYVVLLPLLDALLGTPLKLTVSFGEFTTVFVTYCSLYMGGNTALRMLKRGDSK